MTEGTSYVHKREREEKRERERFNILYEDIFTYIYILHIFTYIYIYLHMFTYIYIYLHIFKYIYIGDHRGFLHGEATKIAPFLAPRCPGQYSFYTAGLRAEIKDIES